MTVNMSCCGKCDVRIPKHRPMLICSICSQFKHYSCNYLSKNEAFKLINDGQMSQWSCFECISSILPINCTAKQPVPRSKSLETSKPNYINSTPCVACNKPVVPNKNSANCHWCEGVCHKSCSKNSLGCIKCCVDIIPGYFYYAHELTGNYHHNNDIFNLYDFNLLINQLQTGQSTSEDDETDEDEITPIITEHLNNCKYTIPSNIQQSKPSELKIMSLNIRSLIKILTIYGKMLTI